MYALGVEGPPAEARIAQRAYHLDRIVKHDFWAATAFYTEAVTGRRAVLKFGRNRRIGILPMHWAGRFLVSRESHFYRRLADVPAVPHFLGLVDRPWIAFGHDYIEGQPVSQTHEQRLNESFFMSLAAVLEQLHDRGVAYIDLHKEQNILVDPAGQPHLIDFQISYDRDSRFLGLRLPRPIRNWLFSLGVRADRYHLVKHKKFRRPDLLSDQERNAVERRVWFIRLHAALVWPYRFVRRRLLKRWRSGGRLLPEGAR